MSRPGGGDRRSDIPHCPNVDAEFSLATTRCYGRLTFSMSVNSRGGVLGLERLRDVEDSLGPTSFPTIRAL